MSTIPIFFARSFLSQPYALLPLLPRVILTALSYLSVFVFAFGLIRMMRQGTKDAWGYAILSLGTVLGYVLFRAGERLAAHEAAGLWLKIASLPASLVILLHLLTIGGAVFSLLGIIQIRRTRITTLSVKESAEILPCGLCYYWTGGFPKLTNRVMEEISYAVRGLSLQNGELLWQALTAPEPEPADGDGTETDGSAKSRPSAEFLRRGDEPVIRLADGRVYAFRRRTLSFEGKLLYEIVASDMTEEYDRADALREKRERAEDTKKRLRALGRVIAELTVEKEVLGMKIRIHDNLNRALLTVKRALARPAPETGSPGTDPADCPETAGKGPENEAVSARLEAARLWREKILSLDYLTQSEDNDDYNELIRSALALGAKIEVLGALPSAPPYREIGALALEIGLSNMLKHTDGEVLTVDCTTSGKMILTNDGTPPSGPIVEGGGLGNLRRRVEGEGGTMTVESAPRFRLTIEMKRK